MDAIHTLKQIESENRNASPEEQEILSRYVGWGGPAEAFDPEKSSWAGEFQELKAILTEDEYAAAKASTLNAHYTSPTVIRAMYAAIEQMGFSGGNILEPSMGIGNFFGMLPETMQGSRLYGVELDSITGRIAQQLYPVVQIYNYVTGSTFDSYMWNTLRAKAKFISQITGGNYSTRICSDISEQELSYAEVAALCAGDPRIKEFMELQVETSRLQVLKASYQDQHYQLEDKLLRTYPAEIEKTRSYIQEHRADTELAVAHPLPADGFIGMEIAGKLYDTAPDAGKAILTACAELGSSHKAVPLGEYRGFQMQLRHDAVYNTFSVELQGQMRYQVELGESARGNITRLDNAIARIPEMLEKMEQKLENLQAQQAAAEAELQKPFPQAAELEEKSARLAQLERELDMNESGTEMEEPDAELEKLTEQETEWEETTSISQRNKKRRPEEVL